MTRTTEALHTVGAVVLSVLVFFALLYLVAPVFEWIVNLYGYLVVPERYGGGAEVTRPSVLTLAVRAVLLSGLSAFAALRATFYLLSEAKAGVVVIVFVSAVALWGVVLALLVPTASTVEAIVGGYLPILLAVVPAVVISYVIWQDEKP